MKLHTLSLTMTMLMLCMHGMSQIERQVDFLNLAADDLKGTYPKNEKVRIKVINVNRFLYKVTGEKTETDFHMTVPPVLGGIKLPGFLNTQIPAGPAPAPKMIGRNTTALQWKNDLEQNVQALIGVQRYINGAVAMHNKVMGGIRSCDSTAAIISTATTTMQAFTGSASNDIQLLADGVKASLESNIKLTKQIDALIQTQFESWQTVDVLQFRKDEFNKKEDVVKMKADLITLQGDLKKAKPANKPAIQSNIVAMEKRIRQAEIGLTHNTEDQATEVKDMTSLLEKAKTLIGDILKFEEEGKTYTLVDDLRKVNFSNFTYYSEIVKMKKDEVKYDIVAASETPLPCNKPMEQQFTVKLRTKGGVKLDFSTGAFFNFGSDKFHGEEYYYQPIDEENTTIQKAEAGKRIGLSIGALMHIYQRSPAKLKIGAAIGASTTVNIDALNFHIGPSLLLGDEERLCLTAGATFREVKLLDSKYSTGINYQTKLVPEAVPMIKKFPVGGFFIALTYNFTRFSSAE